MKTRTLLKLLVVVVFFAGVAGVGTYVQFNQDKAGNTFSDELFGWKYPVVKFPQTGPNSLAYSDIRDPGGIPQGLPVRLKIPIIGVDSAIEDALITPDGRMDVPAGSKNVAWFALGPKPGNVGSAVIGGHFGIKNGVPFVFYDLDKLKVGDKIYVVDDKGETLAFVVREIKLFKRDADATTVFTSDDGKAHLNLITCEGLWNRVNDSYPDRRVVFTDAIPTEEIPPIVSVSEIGTTKAEDIAAFPRTFGWGATGTDVAALQTFLEEKGFLTIPFGVTKGYFGSLTSAAVSEYQGSVGLPQAGVFGPLTRAKFLLELGGDTGLPSARTASPALPSTSEEELESPQSALRSNLSYRALIQFVKNLYSTPFDALITSMLLLSVVFMAVKIIRRYRIRS